MNSQFLLEKLNSSEEFKKFRKENPKSYLCSGFFIIDLEAKNPEDKYHIDYYIPETRKTFSFELENGVKLVPLELRDEEKVLERVSMKNHFDFDEIKELVMDEMEKNKITNKIQKIIFSLQNLEGKDMLLGTVFISGLGLIKVNIEVDNMEITDFEKKSFFEMMKIVKK